MYKDYLKDVYKDFYGEEEGEKKYKEVVSKKEEEFDEADIEQFLLEEDSIELLKKFIDYIKKYSLKEEQKYLNFNFLIQSDNKELFNEIECYIQNAVSKYHYLSNNSLGKISFLEIDTVDEVLECIEKNTIISIRDIKGLDLKDNVFQKKLFHLLVENMDHKIVIIEGTEDELNHFFEFDSDLRENSFPFVLIGRRPDIQDVYQDILKITNAEEKFENDFCLKILDYISETYNKSELNYPNYRNQLCRSLIFNEEIPKIESEKTLDEIFEQLDELVGLEKVKKTLRELVDYMLLRKKSNDLKLNNINLHMVFLGNPGTGKTTVARMVSEILYNLGYIKQNKLIEVTSKDLVAEYVGQTAVKTMSVVERAMGGVLFVDEAYTLATTNSQNSYNGEAIATLIKAMEDYRDDFVVIFAGYTKEMQDFLDSNSGIISRIGYTFEFDDYTDDELIEIFNGMMKKSGFSVTEEAIDVVRNVIKENRNSKNFGNARFVRNVYEKTIIKHATNTKNKKRKSILSTITKEDVSYDNVGVL